MKKFENNCFKEAEEDFKEIHEKIDKFLQNEVINQLVDLSDDDLIDCSRNAANSLPDMFSMTKGLFNELIRRYIDVKKD